MHHFPKIFRVFCIGALPALAAACSRAPDPAAQEPVDPAPGLYRIALSGAGLAGKMDRQSDASYCLKQHESASFPHLLARNYYQLHAGCVSKPGLREGNAIAGEISCAADPKLARGMNRFVYNGVVAADKTTIELRMKLEADIREDAMTERELAQLRLGVKMMERMRFVIEAARVDDCG